MDRLQTELQRLFLHDDDPSRTRAVALEVTRPASWQDLGEVWRGVQVDLDLPPPAIAVSGTDGFQLWLGLQEPVDAATAATFAEALRHRYLQALRPEAFRALAGRDRLPPVEVAPGRWSAFVAPDLAPLFADEPWLDRPPGTDAQADLLSRMAPASPAAFARALQRLQADAEKAPEPGSASTLDPRRFLQQVMQDPAVDLRLRIEAAKALLLDPQGGRREPA